MSTKVTAFLSRHNFIQHLDVSLLADSILDDMNKGLRLEASDEDMIPTWCLPPEKSIKNKSVIVIDAGGTNFRSCLVTFDDKGEPSISEMEKTKMPGVEKELSKKEFFEQFAKNLSHLKNKAQTIGFCFSYPMKITEDGDGVLLGFSKEVKAPEVVGSKIGECLKEALLKDGWDKIGKVSMLNDTVAALLAGNAISKGKVYSSYIGFILGTGMNAAYIQPAIPTRENFPKQIVVCESGKTKNVIRSDFDKDFDKTTAKPGEFYMEKCCSGAYLGPVSLFMLKSAANESLFTPFVCKRMLELESLSTIEMDSYLHNPFNTECILGKMMAECGTEDDYDTLFELLDAVVERSARCAAAILVACAIQSGEGKRPVKPICILCDGSTFFKTHRIFSRVRGYLDECLTKNKNIYWKIVYTDNDITLGTAIAGLI